METCCTVTGYRRKGAGARDSAAGILIALLAIILFSQTIIQLTLHAFLPSLPVATEIVINAVLLAGIVFPALYILVLDPLLCHITERRMAEESLTQCKLDWEYTFDAIDDIITIHDREFNIIRANSAARKILGLHPLGCGTAKCHDYYHCTDHPPEICPCRQLFASGKPVTFEMFAPRLKMYLEVRAIPRLDNDNRLTGLIHVARDITERKNTEAALKESEERYRCLVEFSPEAIYVHNGETIVYANNAAAQLVGADAPDKLIGKPVIDFVHPDQAEFVRARIARIMSRRKGVSSQGQKLLRLDGTVAEIDIASAYIPYNGKPAVQIIVHDVTERKKAESELQAAYTKLEEKKSFIESVIANIQSGIVVTDSEMCVKLVNPYVMRLCDGDCAEIVGSRLDSICPEILSVMADGSDRAEVMVRAGTRDLTVGFRRFDLKGADGAITGHIITLVDLTEIVKIRNEMRSKERLATIGEVVARVAHEMRNPLFGITAVAQILAMELKLTPPQMELMNSLFHESKRLNNLVEELLDCSKEIRLNWQEFDLKKAINESIDINKVFILEKSLDISKNFPEGRIELLGDPERIKQVMINLVKNAVDATPPGGMIHISVGEDGGVVAVELKDSGPGIPEHDLERIFDVFFTTKRHGTGLGLSISRKIVESHGGTLTAGNRSGGGALFTVTLPRLDGAS